MACGGGYGPNLIVSNGWKSILCAWMACEGGYGPNLIVSNGRKSILCVWMACEGGYRTNLIVSKGWKSIICVHGMRRRVQSKPDRVRPDCVKLLEINPMCVNSKWGRVVLTWLCQMAGNQSYNLYVCAWQVEEGTVQTWLCQMVGNQAYVCTWHVKEGTVQTRLCQMAGNQAYMCA